MAIKLRSYVSTFCWMFFTAFFATTICLLAIALPSGRYLMHVLRLWSRTVVRVSGIRVVYRGAEHVFDQTPRIFMANHQSFLDMLVTIPALPDNTRFLASNVQKWIPFFGLAAWLSGGCIFIAQGNLQKSRQSIEKATGRIRRGCCLLVFPEGKRARQREMLPFKKGVFHLTIAAGVPIVPIAISGAGDLMTPGSLAIRPGLVHVRFGAPIAPPHSISAEQLSVQTRAEVSELLAEIQRIAA